MRQVLILSFLVMSNINYGQLLLSNPDYYVYNNSMDTLYLTKIDVFDNRMFWNTKKSSKVYDTIQLDGIGSKEIVFERTYSGTSERNMQAFSSKDSATIHKYEIWNIDTKTLLFEAIDEYEFYYQSWTLYHTADSDSLDGRNKGRCSHKYNFSIDSTGKINITDISCLVCIFKESIDSTGQIIITDTLCDNNNSCFFEYDYSNDNMGQAPVYRINYNNKNNDCIVDKKEGFYKFSNGKYTSE